MRARVFAVVMTVMLLVGVARLSAQSEAGILLVWDNILLLQPLQGGNPIALGTPAPEQRQLLPQNGLDVFRLLQSPLATPPADGHGFHHGVWSLDRARFAYLTIAPDASLGRVFVQNGDSTTEIHAERLSPLRGYLDPLAWSPDGALLLTERFMLYNLTTLRVWRYDFTTGRLSLLLDQQIPALSGNSLVLPGGTAVLIGFDTQYRAGYMLNLTTLTLERFSTGFELQHPPGSVFERYAVEILGVHVPGLTDDWLANTLPISPPTADDPLTYATEPWLHWMLPDAFRAITCYPDSVWTTSNFSTTCPGLSSPRQYPGHQGTDVGGKPDGLPLGTPVYATAPGVVVWTEEDCIRDDVPCNDSYGNTVLIEHTRVVNGETQTWFSGYAHLQSVLVDVNTAVTDLTTIIALSGDTGLGGAHLHFELLYPHGARAIRWVDPWDNRDGRNLWLGSDVYPLAATGEAATVIVCSTIDDNNIRSGAGTDFPAVAQTRADTEYSIAATQVVDTGLALGDWYLVQVGEAEPLGWIWSGLMTDCVPRSVES